MLQNNTKKGFQIDVGTFKSSCASSWSSHVLFRSKVYNFVETRFRSKL